MSIAVDEFGHPFIVLREQENKKRLTGIEAQKSNILAARSVSDTLRTSLGPKGMDKIICSPDGEVTVTNDGATILHKMEVEHPCAKLLVELATAQDDEIGDGTTGVVVLAGELLEQASRLLDKGLHPFQISEGFETAAEMSIRLLSYLSEKASNNNQFKNDDGLYREFLIKGAMTALGSKVVSRCQRHLAEIAVDAVLSVADTRQDVNFDLIKVEGKPGGRLEDSTLVKGIVLDKDFSHPQMRKVVEDARIAILTCPFEPPKPKTKHKLDIQTVEDYKALQEIEQKYFKDMIQAIKDTGANFVVCQWGFDDEANHLLFLNDLPAVRWVGGVELELIAIATGGSISPRFEDLKSDKLGRAASIKELTCGTEDDQMVLIEGCPFRKAVTVIIRGGNQMIVDEAKRSFHDAVCCVRNLVRDPRIVPGAGASEIAAALVLESYAEGVSDVTQYAIEAFSEALLAIPEALADNSGMNALSVVAEAKAEQVKGNSNIGIGCLEDQEYLLDASKAGIFEPLVSKHNQILLATQVVRMILKIDDVIVPSEFQEN